MIFVYVGLYIMVGTNPSKYSTHIFGPCLSILIACRSMQTLERTMHPKDRIKFKARFQRRQAKRKNKREPGMHIFTQIWIDLVWFGCLLFLTRFSAFLHHFCILLFSTIFIYFLLSSIIFGSCLETFGVHWGPMGSLGKVAQSGLSPSHHAAQRWKRLGRRQRPRSLGGLYRLFLSRATALLAEITACNSAAPSTAGFAACWWGACSNRDSFGARGRDSGLRLIFWFSLTFIGTAPLRMWEFQLILIVAICDKPTHVAQTEFVCAPCSQPDQFC